MKAVPTFSVQLRRRGKFQPIATDLTKEQALRFGSERAISNLARTFRISPTGKQKEMFGLDEGDIPELRKFREFQIRRGRAIPTPSQFIQRTQFALSSMGEKQEIRQSKLMRGIPQ